MDERTSRVGRVHQALRDAITEQALEPGAKLPEDAIGEQFNVSRTVVRRALERLAAEELVEIRPNRGASVAAPGIEVASDLFAVRIDLERVVARRICGALNPRQIARLKKAVALEELALREDRPAYIRLAAHFHILLAEMANSPLLLRYMTQMVWRSALVLRLHGKPRWHTCNVQEHLDLIAAIEAGDLALTDRLMTTHLESVLTRALDGPKIDGEPSLSDVLVRYSTRGTDESAKPARARKPA